MIHTKPNEGETDCWLTPPALIGKLGKFDVDPCAHPQQFYKTADRMISLPEDGLSVPWKGRVWLNPPYGRALPVWLAHMAAHDHGTALVPARTEVESWFWPFIWERARLVLFLRGRLYFHRPDGSLAGNAGHGSVLVAYGGRDATILDKADIVGKRIWL